MEDIIIIGAGPIGLYAGILASLHSLKGIIIESSSSLGGQLAELYPEKAIVDLPGFTSITASAFIKNLLAQYNSRENKPEIHLSESVTGFNKKEDGSYEVVATRGTYFTKTILLATGMGNFSPRLIGLPDEKKYKNIIYSLKDKETLKDKKVVILGGGNSAVDFDLLLAPIVSELSIVHHRDEFRAQGESVEAMKKTKTKIYLSYSISALIGEGDVLKEIEIKNAKDNSTSKISLDVLFVNYGMVPGKNVFPVEKNGTDIKVTDAYKTSLDNVFAIGNSTNYPGKVKNITCGMGEAVIAITKIDQIVNPSKNIPIHF